MPKFRIIPERSLVWMDASSSLHPIHATGAGLEGWFEAEVGGGGIDLSVPPRGRLELAVELLSSGNPLYDREMRRRVQARRHPTIVGELREMQALDRPGHYRVRGDVTFRGVTRTVEDVMTVELDGRTIQLEGKHTFDIRDFEMEAPKILMLKVHPEVAVRVQIVAEQEA